MVDETPILQRRRIEAVLLKHVYETVCRRSGADEAKRVIAETVRASAIQQGESFANRLGHAPTLEDFLAILPLWTADDALEIEVLTADDARLDFNVTRCRYAEMYRELGMGDIGHLLSCNRDGAFCEGYNPEMSLTRSQTIMQGATHCDFRYRMAPKEPSAR